MHELERDSTCDEKLPDEPLTIPAPGRSGATLNLGAAMLRMDVLRIAEGETDVDPPHPIPTLAWRTPDDGAAARKEQ